MNEVLLTLKWMNWSELDGSLDEPLEKTWSVYRNGAISVCTGYTLSGTMPNGSRQLCNRELKGLKIFLRCFFRSSKRDLNGVDGEAWNIIYYNKSGTIRRRFDGYVYAHPIIRHVISSVCKGEIPG